MLKFPAFLQSKNDNKATQNVLLDKRLIDYSIGDRADRNAAGWRYGFFSLCAVASILGIGLVVAATTRHDVISVFREDGQGTVSYVGQATTNAPPSNQYGVEKALADWIKCFRNIPNLDAQQIEMNGECTLAVIPDTNSQAYKFVVRQLSAYPPLKLNTQNHVHRDVDKVQVSPIAALAYSLKWREYIYNNGDLTNTLYQDATITLAAPAAPPADPNIARVNPEGLNISTIDPHWSDQL